MVLVEEGKKEVIYHYLYWSGTASNSIPLFPLMSSFCLNTHSISNKWGRGGWTNSPQQGEFGRGDGVTKLILLISVFTAKSYILVCIVALNTLGDNL